MANAKVPLDLEAVIRVKAEAYKLEEDALRKAVREELTVLLARGIAKQVAEGEVETPKWEATGVTEEVVEEDIETEARAYLRAGPSPLPQPIQPQAQSPAGTAALKRGNFCNLSRQSGVDRSFLSRVLRGKAPGASLKTIRKIAAAVGMTPDEVTLFIESQSQTGDDT